MKLPSDKKPHHVNLEVLSSNDLAREVYCKQFCLGMRTLQYDNLNEHAFGVAKVVVDALPPIVSQLPTPNRPWISVYTLSLIGRRNGAREVGNYIEEQVLHKEVRASVRRDRAGWLNAPSW